MQSLPHLYQIVAVCEPDDHLRGEAQNALHLPDSAVYSNFTALLERDDVDLVDVCTPPGVRRGLVLAAAEAGRHILSEKPLATIPKEAAEMVAAARSHHVQLGLMHNYLFVPEFVAARSIIDRGEVGEVEVVILNYLGVFDNPGIAVGAPNWRHDLLSAGGGVLMDMMHVVYVAERLLGAQIRAVSAYVDARRSGGQVEDLALCRFETATNVALVNIGWGVGPGGIEISGSHGRISIRYRGGGTMPFDPLDMVRVVTDSKERIEPVQEGALPGPVAVLEDFAHAFARGVEPLASGEQGLRALEAVLCVYESAALQRTVALPLRHDDPVYQHGVRGLAHLDIAPESRLRLRGMFGLSLTR